MILLILWGLAVRFGEERCDLRPSTSCACQAAWGCGNYAGLLHNREPKRWRKTLDWYL